ncbi:MAG: hypothetical protein RL745_831, partial [Actinomycetota bacterium]
GDTSGEGVDQAAVGEGETHDEQ